MTRVQIATEIRIYREGLAQCLGQVEGIEVVATAASWAESNRLLNQTRPNVLLADVDLPESIAAVRSMTSERPEIKVVALGVTEVDEVVIPCAEAGVSGYVTRDQSLADVVQAVRGATNDEVPCSARIAAALLRRITAVSSLPARGARLTTREVEIVDLIDEGFTNPEIAVELCIEVATVKNHVHNILEKLDVRRRADAAAVVRGDRRGAGNPRRRRRSRNSGPRAGHTMVAPSPRI